MLTMNGREKYAEASTNVKKILGSMACEEIQTMDESTLKTIQAVFGFLDAAEEVIAEQEKALKQIDSKLDELIKMVGVK